MTQSHHAETGRVLFDTSVCISVLRAAESDMAESAREFLMERQAAICEPVVMELAQGCHSERQFDAVGELVANCYGLTLDPGDWLVAGKARAADLKRGLTVSPFDYLISAVATRHAVPLLTADDDYRRIGIKATLFLS